MHLNIDPVEDYYYAIALAALAFFTAPTVIYVNNFIDLHHVDPLPSLAVLAISAIIVAAVLCTLLYGLSLAGLKSIGMLLRPLFFFLLFMTLIQPLIGNTAMLKLGSISLPVWWLAMMTFLIIAVAWSFTKMSGAVLFIPLAFIALHTLVHVYQLLTADTAKNTAPIEQLSKDKNLIVLSMDGVTRDTALEVLNENPAMKAKLKDFVYFTNAITSAPNTRASIIAEIAGSMNLKKRYGNERTMLQKIPREKLLHNVLDANGYTVATYGEYSHTLKNQKNGFPVGRLLKNKSVAFHIVNAVDLFHFAMPAALWPDSLAKHFQNLWLTVAGGGRSVSPRLDRLNKHKGERWERALLLSGIEFDNYLSKLRASGTAPRAQFLHFVHTHWPISIDAKCAYKANDFKWYLKHQNREAHKAVVFCSLSKFAAFLDKLKDLKIYDKATIVLKGDHGEIIPYMDRSKLESFTFHGHKHLGFARYTPMLAIKGRSRVAGQLTLDDRPAALSDLATTLCKVELDKKAACNVLKGYDLLNKTNNIPSNASYDMYLPMNGTSDWKLSDHVAVKIPRRANIFAALNAKLSEALVKSAPACNAPMNVTNGIVYNNGKTDSKRWVTWRHNNTWFVKTKLPRCASSHGILRITAIPGATPSTGLAIAVSAEGKPPQVLPVEAGDKSQSWIVTLPTSIKPDAILEISLTPAAGQKPVALATIEFTSKPPGQ